jgi:hypothetical protein
LKLSSKGKTLDDYEKRLEAFKVNYNPDIIEEEPWSPERWYQEIKARWYFHPYSWYMLRVTVPDLTPDEYNMTCNGQTGCIPECRFYEPQGRIEPEELANNIKSLEEFIAWKNTPCSKDTCSMHPDHAHKEEKENPTTDGI